MSRRHLAIAAALAAAQLAGCCHTACRPGLFCRRPFFRFCDPCPPAVGYADPCGDFCCRPRVALGSPLPALGPPPIPLATPMSPEIDLRPVPFGYPH